eukprot:TRINITY_DN4814_c0_g1_i19.p1 TRINITY_DN4814_c0_g1~~TRINITY_DN4814_c0_g1_i19.p1  ORF type:complete len:470 (+),score=97.46 TRINITY_DN4814_c0_g1_i19:37-1446(+)
MADDDYARKAFDDIPTVDDIFNSTAATTTTTTTTQEEESAETEKKSVVSTEKDEDLSVKSSDSPKNEKKHDEKDEDFRVKSLDSPKSEKKKDEDQGSLRVSITDTEKNGDGVNAFISYTVKTKAVNDSIWGDREMTAIRRYRDFSWLHSGLKAEFKTVIIPPLPEKSITNRFSPEFIEYRRYELEKFLRRVIKHPKLVDSVYTKTFLESSRELNRTEIKSEAEQKAVPKKKGFFSSLTDKVTTMTSAAPVEIDEWFTDTKEYLKGLETQLHTLHTKTTIMTKKRRDFAQIWEDLSLAAVEYSKSEADKDSNLNKLFSKFTEVTHQLSNLNMETVDNEIIHFEFSIKDYTRITTAVKDLLTNRDSTLLKCQIAEKNYEQKKQKSDKNTSTSKANAFQTEVTEAEKQRDTAKQSLEDASKECKEEIETFMKTKNKDITNALRELVQTNMNHELRVLDLWKELLRMIEESSS